MRFYFGIILSVPLFVSCAGLPGDEGKTDPHNLIQGWVDDNTYRVSTTGSAGDSGIIGIQKRRLALRDAEKKAGLEIEKLLAEHSVDSEKGTEIIKSGKTVYRAYDSFHNCEIVYEINKKGLRNIVK